jgi:hypothetical protein
LDQLQKEFDADYPQAGVFILGINEAGEESENEAMCEKRDIPWLQDTEEANWWGSWGITWRDVVILDRDGNEADIVNLLEHNLSSTDEYAALKALLLDVAEQ